jgi:major membrane immunogen (membrane-anchored lipoprotein)
VKRQIIVIMVLSALLSSCGVSTEAKIADLTQSGCRLFHKNGMGLHKISDINLDTGTKDFAEIIRLDPKYSEVIGLNDPRAVYDNLVTFCIGVN